MASREDNISYSFHLLLKHQESCGQLVILGENGDTRIECKGCGATVRKGDNSAIFSLRGYEIELV